MNVDKILTDTFTALAPTYADVGPESDEPYIVFNYGELPAYFGDDLPHASKYLVQVHVYAPMQMDVKRLRNDVKRLIIESGFTYKGYTNASVGDQSIGYGTDNKATTAYQHYVYECEIAGGLYDDG